MPSYGTFRSHTGFGTELAYGSTAAVATYVPTLSNDDYTDDQGLVLDVGGRAKASHVYAVYSGVQQGKWAATFPYYPIAAARFWPRVLGTDTIGSSSNGGWQHTFTLADLPVSDTIYDFFGSTNGDRAFSGAQCEKVEFKFDRKSGLATIKPSYVSAAPTTGPGAENTASYGTDPALRGYEAVFSVAGSTRTTLLTAELTLTRAVDLIFAGNNSQRPSAVEVGDFDVTGKFSFYGSTDQPYTDYRANTQQAVELVITDTLAGSSWARLDILMTKAVFTKVTPNRSGDFLRYDVELQGIHNATDGGPIQISTTIATSSSLST